MIGPAHAHLLDPEENALIQKAMQTSQAFRQMQKNVPSSKGPVEKAVDDIIDFKTAAEKGIQTGKIKSIIHPTLADHVRREAISTWVIWLVAGVLLLSYCIFRNDTLFTFVQAINITAIMATIILARRGNRICPHHLKRAATTREQN
jgi:hypothetical protein